ncbi:MAG: glycosyltransferase [Nitrosospira sp.]
MTAPSILHICGDYPDVFQSTKTPVIARLVDGLSAHANNFVFSINRVNNPLKEQIKRENNLWSIQYFAPPLGFMQSFFLDRLARLLARLLEENEIHPVILIGHKFTIESYVCWRLSQRFKIQYVAAFMGNTDCKVFLAKPHYRRKFHEVARYASAIVFPTPWCEQFFSHRLLQPAGVPRNRWHVIPFISGESLLPIESHPSSTQRFVTICRLDLWRLKNLHRLIEAIAVLRKSGGDWSLDIVGPGSSAAEKILKNLILSYGLNGYVRLLGEKSRDQIDTLLPYYCAMVMPSYPESFGLVYLEALAKGVPIMSAKNAGMDGFFPQSFPGVIVKHDRLGEIVQGLITLSEQSNRFRSNILAMTSKFRQFDRKTIVSRYVDLLTSKELI